MARYDARRAPIRIFTKCYKNSREIFDIHKQASSNNRKILRLILGKHIFCQSPLCKFLIGIG